MKKGVVDLQRMKETGKKVAWLTGYDFPMAQLAEKDAMHMLLVRDSMGICVYGYSGVPYL